MPPIHCWHAIDGRMQLSMWLPRCKGVKRESTKHDQQGRTSMTGR